MVNLTNLKAMTFIVYLDNTTKVTGADKPWTHR